jgi:hypothetical protein
MAVTVKKIELWRREVDNKPGMLADTLEPFASAGADLQVVMGYSYGDAKAAIELFPVKGKKSAAAAKAVGMSTSSIPALLVEGDNKPGLGHGVARAIADAGINLHFLVAQTLGRKFTAVFGFGNAADATKAVSLIKKASAARKAAAAKKAAPKKAASAKAPAKKAAAGKKK